MVNIIIIQENAITKIPFRQKEEIKETVKKS
jgi:hypothetical protein